MSLHSLRKASPCFTFSARAVSLASKFLSIPLAPERQHNLNVIVCETCDAAFDYDDENILNLDDQPAEFVA